MKEETKNNEDGIPRRSRMDMWSRSERAIWDAMQAVEEEGAHPLLTEAVLLLQQAKDKVSDWVELCK